MASKWWIALMAVLVMVSTAACSSAEPSGEVSVARSTFATATTSSPGSTTTTTLAATTSVASPTIDEAFLAEQVAMSYDPNRPGAVIVSVYGPDGEVVSAAAGTDPSRAAPTPDEVFRLASISKLFTSLTVLSLVDDGLVDLDAPLSRCVDRFDIREGVTVRDALQHTSGIPNYTEVPGFADMMLDDPSRVWTPEESIALVPEGELDFEPGTAFVYSNTNYIILGMLIEEVTGLQYHEAVRERLIEPLALTDTYLAGLEVRAVRSPSVATTAPWVSSSH